MPPLSLIWIDLDESITHGQMDGRTDQWMDGQTLFRDTTTHSKASSTGTRARMDNYVCIHTHAQTEHTF